MQIPKSLLDRFPSEDDPETNNVFFGLLWDEEPGQKVLEIGAHDSPIASILSRAGHSVIGVDLRPYDHTPLLHTHIVSDFCSLPQSFWDTYRGKMDCVVAISALEHFGLNTYGETGYLLRMYDAIAVRYVWDLLREGGVFYVVVPFGGRYIEVGEHWRVYDWAAIVDRIVQEFTIEKVFTSVVEEFTYGVRHFHVGEDHGLVDALFLTAGQPYISIGLKLRKLPYPRKVATK